MIDGRDSFGRLAGGLNSAPQGGVVHRKLVERGGLSIRHGLARSERLGASNNTQLVSLGTVCALAGLLVAGPAQAQCTPTTPCGGPASDLGTLEGHSRSAAYGVSADGSVVVG